MKKTILAGLVGLTALTSSKDNVHFVPLGTIDLYNTEKMQYVYGIVIYTARLNGNCKGGIKTYGLITGTNEAGENAIIDGE